MPKFKLPKLKLPRRKQKPKSDVVVAKKKFWKTKKFLVGVGVAVVVLIGGIAIGNGAQNDTMYKLAMRNVAEARYFMLASTANNTTVQFIVGKREEPFAQNGTAGALTDFALVNVNGHKGMEQFPQIDAVIKIGTKTHDIVLIQNPYNPLNFSNDIIKTLGREVEACEEVEITLMTTSNPPTFKLQNTMDKGAISWDQAVAVATTQLGDKLKNQSFETYVSIIHNVAQDSGAFWYVQFFTADGKTHYVVVAPDGSSIGNCGANH